MIPSLFVSHGAPTLPIDDIPARAFLQGLGATFERPRGIVIGTAPSMISKAFCGRFMTCAILRPAIRR